MCTCNNRSRDKILKVYGVYEPHSMFKKYLGTTIVQDFGDKRRIRQQITKEHPDWTEYK